MARYIVTSPIKRDGQAYAVGDGITLDDTTAETLDHCIRQPKDGEPAPDPKKPAKERTNAPRSTYIVISPIKHDGKAYELGKPIELTDDEADAVGDAVRKPEDGELDTKASKSKAAKPPSQPSQPSTATSVSQPSQPSSPATPETPAK